MNPPSGGGGALAPLIEATGLTISTDDLATATGSGCDDPFAFEPERAIGVLVEAIQRVHLQAPGSSDTSATDVALTVTPEELVARAQAQLDLPDGERSELSPAYAHMRREDLVAVLAEQAAIVAQRSTGPVLNQGLPTLANLRFKGIELLGFADWSQASLADPHLDLAVACRDLLGRFGAPPVREFLEAFSAGSKDASQLDPVRLDWYTLAVELGS